MHAAFSAAFRLSVVTLLILLVWMVRHEGERIVGNLWYPSEPLQVEVTNNSNDAVPVQVQQSDTPSDASQAILQAAEEARMSRQMQGWKPNTSNLSPEEKRRFDALYGQRPTPAASVR